MTSVTIYITSAVTECDEWGGERVINAVCGDWVVAYSYSHSPVIRDKIILRVHRRV